jgi:hypothetical protein
MIALILNLFKAKTVAAKPKPKPGQHDQLLAHAIGISQEAVETTKALDESIKQLEQDKLELLKAIEALKVRREQQQKQETKTMISGLIDRANEEYHAICETIASATYQTSKRPIEL